MCVCVYLEEWPGPVAYIRQKNVWRKRLCVRDVDRFLQNTNIEREGKMEDDDLFSC